MEILKKEALSIPEVKELLGITEEDESSIGEYLVEYSYMDAKTATELKKKLAELGLPENTAIMIINSPPKLVEELSVFPGCEELDAEVKEKIIDTVRSHVKMFQEGMIKAKKEKTMVKKYLKNLGKN